jgi:CO dehydrogenase maturation factor
LAKAFRNKGLKVIAVDADPDANLARALGFPQDSEITPLVELKELITERVGAEPGKAAVYFQLNPRVDDIPERFAAVKDGIKLMVMGTIRRGGSGCACPENVMVKQLINHLLLQRDEVLIMDMEAGIEHLGRGTAQFVDLLVVVVEPTSASLQTFTRIKKLAAELGLQKVAVVANRIRGPKDLERIQSEIQKDIWCVLPYSETLMDYAGGPVGDDVNAGLAGFLNRIRQEPKNG